MEDDEQPRSKWKLARVEEAYASEDGVVRKVKLAMSTLKLDKQGRRAQPIQYLDHGRWETLVPSIRSLTEIK